MARARHWRLLGMFTAIALAGCSGGGGPMPAGEDTPTPTPTAVASATPTGVSTASPTATAVAAATATATATTTTGSTVSGVVLVGQDVRAAAGDALGAPPASWSAGPDGKVFDRALSYASWTLSGARAATGSTGPDGRFEIPDLPPGSYRLDVRKTVNGDLVQASVPLTVGDAGGAEVVVEIDSGKVRSAVTYQAGAVTVRDVQGPDGTRLQTRDGRVAEVGGIARSFVDPDGDGLFVPDECTDQLWLCGADGECGAGRTCQCTASCPLCEDCGPTVCAPPGGIAPYRCDSGTNCTLPGDRCVCVSSCPDCDDCAFSACVPSCAPVGISDIAVSGPSQLVVGQGGSVRATAKLDDGSSIDVTAVVDWQSSDPEVASVSSWGAVVAHSVGSTSITAALGDTASDPWGLEVVERPPLQRIEVQNLSCLYPLGLPAAGGVLADPALPSRPDILPPPDCRQVVRIGGTLQFLAVGEYQDGSREDLTSEVEWTATPAEVGDVAEGLFTARQEGTAQIRAALDGLTSDATEVRVVSQPTVISLSIYPIGGALPPLFGPVENGMPVPDAAAQPCLGCDYGITVLRGDQVRFGATAYYDTGEWREVTDEVVWRSSDTSVASIDAKGAMSAVNAGEAQISASLDGVDSGPVTVKVVDQATLLSLSIAQDGQDRVVAKGDQAFFRASGYYDVGFQRDVTDKVTWNSSDESVGGFDEPGVFTGRAAGTVEVWAELDGQESNHLSFQVFEQTDISFCDPEHVNRGTWSDTFNRVVLESNCAQYTPPDVATLRFTVTERQRPVGIFDPCLDLYVERDGQRVRTIREQGCGRDFAAPEAPAADETLKYQVNAFWDLKDDRGNVVPPGRYTIQGRFYLYYDPVVSLDVDVVAPNGRIPCEPNVCGNGCGYVHQCGDLNPPPNCPAVCVSICECPPGWGITPDGDCEACTEECCPPGATCAINIPPCEPPPACCAPGKVCVPELPPCKDCCGPNEDCVEGIPPCEPTPAPTPVPEGACFTGPDDCSGSSFPTSRERCCALAQGGLPLPVSWCAADQLDPSAGTCGTCSNPCATAPATCCPPGETCAPVLLPCAGQTARLP